MVTYSSIITKCWRVIGNDHMILVFLAMIAGGLAGSAVTLFREFIALIQARSDPPLNVCSSMPTPRRGGKFFWCR